MTDDTLDWHETLKDAYLAGYEEAGGSDAHEELKQSLADPHDEDRVRDAAGQAWDGFTQSARYANVALPRLREMAGFEDGMGAGTYTVGGEDEAQAMSDIAHAFSTGFHDALVGEGERPEVVV